MERNETTTIRFTMTALSDQADWQLMKPVRAALEKHKGLSWNMTFVRDDIVGKFEVEAPTPQVLLVLHALKPWIG